MDALLEELHCSDVAAGDLGPEVGQARADAEGAEVQTAGLPRPARGVEVHVTDRDEAAVEGGVCVNGVNKLSVIGLKPSRDNSLE